MVEFVCELFSVLVASGQADLVLDTSGEDSVVDKGCLSRIRLFSIPDPIFFHPGSTSKNLTI